MDSDPALQNLLQLRPGTFRPVIFGQSIRKFLLLILTDNFLALQELRIRPTLLAIETKHQRRSHSPATFTAHHFLDQLVKHLVFDPAIVQRHFAVVTFDQFQITIVT